MFRRLHRSTPILTLFPYTTLFRSLDGTPVTTYVLTDSIYTKDGTSFKPTISALEQKIVEVEQKIPTEFPPVIHTHVKSDITDLPNIPTLTSQLTNDIGYTTSEPTNENINGEILE